MTLPGSDQQCKGLRLIQWTGPNALLVAGVYVAELMAAGVRVAGPAVAESVAAASLVSLTADWTDVWGERVCTVCLAACKTHYSTSPLAGVTGRACHQGSPWPQRWGGWVRVCAVWVGCCLVGLLEGAAASWELWILNTE